MIQVVEKVIVTICYLPYLHGSHERVIVIFKMSQDIYRKNFTANNIDTFCQKFVFYFFKAIGLATVSYSHVWSDTKKSWILVFKHSRIGIIYNIALIICLIPLDVINVILIYKEDIFLQNHQEILVFTLYGFLFSFGNVFTLIVFIFQHDKMTSIANKIYKLRELTNENDLTKNKFFSILFVNSLISFIMVNLPSVLFQKVILIYCMALSFNISVTFYLLIQYILVLELIKGFFKSINDTLNDESFQTAELNLSLRLEKLMFLYTCVCDVSQEISDFYSLPLIWALLNIFYILLWTAYNVIQSLFIFNQSPDVYFFYNLNYIYLCIFLLPAFVVNVTETIKEVV